MASLVKRILVGRPLATHEAHHERLPKTIALAVFSADAIASSAFATQEILHVLVPVAAMAAIGYLVPISLLVVVLLAIVVSSYRQTIHAYPSGGGSHIVSRENLGRGPSLVAGASLLVDYVLTVAVSIAAGTAAITSAIVTLRDARVAVAVTLTVLLALANLRGVRESGTLFAIPTYAYVATMLLLIGVGLARSSFGDLGPIPVDEASLAEVTDDGASLAAVSLFLLMRAFSSGAVALSGVEAISNGVPAGVTTLLIPLFAVGLFASFTLSQAGMVVHHWRLREPGWRWKLAVNATGTAATAVVLVVVVTSKFLQGAWIPTVVIPLIVGGFVVVRRHYDRIGRALEGGLGKPIPPVKNTVVVLVGRLHQGVTLAIAYARSLQPLHLVAVTVAVDPEHGDAIAEGWRRHGFDVPLEILSSPYREITEPVLAFLDRLDAGQPDDVVTVVIPEFVIHSWWAQTLHNQSAFALKSRLLFRPNTVVTSVPIHILDDHVEPGFGLPPQVLDADGDESAAAPR